VRFKASDQDMYQQRSDGGIGNEMYEVIDYDLYASIASFVTEIATFDFLKR